MSVTALRKNPPRHSRIRGLDVKYGPFAGGMSTIMARFVALYTALELDLESTL
jgi:hypothetical protein